MAHVAVRAGLSRVAVGAVLAFSGGGGLTMLSGPLASADAVAYLVNVSVRPGYHFASADEALSYGHRLCAKVADGHSYSAAMSEVKGDFGTADEFQASYLISQAVNELCPESIWQLRRSATNYRPPGH